MLDGTEVTAHDEQTTTPGGVEEQHEETVDELEDRLVTALQRAEQLEQRVSECEREIRELRELTASRTVPEPGNPEDTGNPIPPPRTPDTPPRAHTPLADWYFRRIRE